MLARDRVIRWMCWRCVRHHCEMTSPSVPMAGKGWFVILRLYGALEPWFEKTGRPDEIEHVDPVTAV